MEPKRHIDWMCIGIEKTEETDEFAGYDFVCGIYEPNPNRRTGSVRTGECRGRLRVAKKSGEVSLLTPMPDDEGSIRFKRAARKIKQHWESGEYPSKTIYACG